MMKHLKTKTVLTIDTETNGLNYDNLVLFQIGDKYDQFVIDARFTDISILNSILSSKRITKIFHNAKFDVKVLKKLSLKVEHIFDTMIADYVLYTGLDITHSLANCSIRYLDIDINSNQLSLWEPFFDKNTRNSFANITWENAELAQIYYAAKDIEITHRIYEKQLELLRLNKLEKVVKLENEFTLVLADIEFNGLPIDTKMWMKEIDTAQSRVEENLIKLNTFVDSPINWNSSKQAIPVFKKYGVPTKVIDKIKSKRENEKVEKDSLQSIHIKKYVDSYEIVGPYINYKEQQKLVTSYGTKFLAKINPNTLRLHTNFIQILHTGRTASSNPNLQQIPRDKEFRDCIRPPKGVFVISDYTQQELHVVASKSKDVNMLNTLKEKKDLHKVAASALYQVSIDNVTKDQRQDGKTTNFLIVYGGGAQKLAEQFNVPLSQAKIMINNYFRIFPKLKEYQDKCLKDSLDNGYILIDKLGRKSYIADFELFKECRRLINTLGKNCPQVVSVIYKTFLSEVSRKSANFPIQGESASMSKLAGIFLRRHKKAHLYKILLLIHDEWLVECDEEVAEEVKGIIEECMTKASRYFSSIEVPAEAIIKKSWIK